MFLNDKKEAAKIKALIEKGIDNGLSANKIEKALREEKLGYTRSQILKDVKEIKSSIKVKGSGLPGPEAHPLNVSKNQPKEKRVSKGLLGSQGATPRTNKDKTEHVFKTTEKPETGSKTPKKSKNNRTKDPGTKTGKPQVIGPRPLSKKEQEARRKEILKDLVLEDKGKKASGTEYIKRLKSEGLTYRKTDMEKDLRRALTTEHSKTPGAKKRAEKFFDNVYENARKMLKANGQPYNRKAVNKFIEDWKKGSKDLSAAEDAAMTDFYLSMYGKD